MAQTVWYVAWRMVIIWGLALAALAGVTALAHRVIRDPWEQGFVVAMAATLLATVMEPVETWWIYGAPKPWLVSLAVAVGWCSWRGHRWTLLCTDLPGSFRRQCTQCRVQEASPDLHGGRRDWVTW